MKILRNYIAIQVVSATLLVLLVILSLDFLGTLLEELSDIEKDYTFTEALLYLLMIMPGKIRLLLQQPLECASRVNEFDVIATVKGGGLSGQAGAVRHGISKALTCFEPTLRGVLKAGGFMTRDSRVVERKKYGRAKARRSFQFSKR